MKILHLSDIHIRLQSHHEEYKECFRRLYEDIDHHFIHNEKNCIVITGDLFHNKVELTPECIVVALDFLTELSKRLPTFLIAGNHDALLNNPDRMDTISALLHHRDIPNFFYLKYTGIYHLASLNTVFYVDSLLGISPHCETFDERNDDINDDRNDDRNENPLLFIPLSSVSDALEKGKARFSSCPNSQNYQNWSHVALYHGGVGKYKCQNLFEMEGEKSLDAFHGYDMVLLGDIHIPQFLDKEKRVAYAGSLLSQNSGEGGYEHGYLVWDTRTKTAEFHAIPNPKAYTSLYATEDGISLFSPEKNNENFYRYPFVNEEKEKGDKLFWEKVPTNARITLYGEEREIFEKAETEIEKATRGTHTFTSMKRHYYNLKNSNLVHVNSDLSSSTLSSSTAHELGWCPKDVDDFLDLQPGTYSEAIRDLLKKTPFQSPIKSNLSTQTWNILRVEGKHLFGYKDFFLDFENWKAPHVVGIFGKNSAGKSTIVDIITLLLYSRITRYSHGQTVPVDVIHRQETKAEGKIWIQMESDTVLIHKKFTKQGQKIKTVQEIWKGETRLTLEDRKKMDKWLESTLGTFDHFLGLCVQSQQYRIGFREMTQKDRKEYLYHHLHLNMYDSLRDEYHEKHRQLTVAKNEMDKHPEWSGFRVEKEKKEWEEWETKEKDTGDDITKVSRQLQKVETEMSTLVGSGSIPMEVIKKNQSKFEVCYEELKKSCGFDHLIVDISGGENAIRSRQESVSSTYSLKIKEVESQRIEERMLAPQPPAFLSKRIKDCFHPEWLPSHEFSNEDVFRQGVEQCRMFHEEYHQFEKEKLEWDTHIKQKVMEEKASLRHLSTSSQCRNWTMDMVENFLKKKQKGGGDKKDNYENYEREWLEWKEKASTTFLKWEAVWQEYEQFEKKQHHHTFMMECLEKERERLAQTAFNPNCEVCQKNPVHQRLKEIRKEYAKEEDGFYQNKASMDTCQSQIRNIQEQMTGKTLFSSLDNINNMNNINSNINHDKTWWTKEERRREEKYRQWKEYVEDTRLGEEVKVLRCNLLIETKIQEMERETYPFLARWESLGSSKKKMETMDTIREMEQYWEDWKGHQVKWESFVKEKERHERRLALVDENIARFRHEEEWLNVQYSIVLWKILEERENKRMQLLNQVNRLRKSKDDLQKLHYEAHYNAVYKKENIEKYLVWKTRLEETEKELLSTGLILPLLSRNGLPLFLLGRMLPRFEREWNRLLDPFLEGAKIHVMMENQDIEFFVTKADGTTSSRFFGGMEGFMLDVGCKMVIHQLSHEPKPPLFIVDEGISVLDKEHMENLPLFFDFLQSLFSHVMVISHIPQVRDFVDSSLYVEKKDGYATIRHS